MKSVYWLLNNAVFRGAPRARKARASGAPLVRKFGFLSIRESLIMTSAYASTLQPLELGIKKLSRVGKVVSDRYVAFRFGAKLAILGATNAVARVKI